MFFQTKYHGISATFYNFSLSISCMFFMTKYHGISATFDNFSLSFSCMYPNSGETYNSNACLNHLDFQLYESSNVNVIFMWYVCFVSHEEFLPAVPLFKTEFGL
jgi:hypothetical protein